MQYSIKLQGNQIQDEGELHLYYDGTTHWDPRSSPVILQAFAFAHETNKEMHQGCEQFKSVAQRKDCKITAFNFHAF